MNAAAEDSRGCSSEHGTRIHKRFRWTCQARVFSSFKHPECRLFRAERVAGQVVRALCLLIFQEVRCFRSFSSSHFIWSVGCTAEAQNGIEGSVGNIGTAWAKTLSKMRMPGW
jgi:hypothetical protein